MAIALNTGKLFCSIFFVQGGSIYLAVFGSFYLTAYNSVLAIEYILLFKIKAWMDLSKRKENGEQIDSRDVNKHKNDIFRLLANISPSSKVEIDDMINDDVNRFMENVSKEKVDLRSIGIQTASFEEMLDRIRKLYVRTA